MTSNMKKIMGILDSFVDTWTKQQEEDKKLRESLPKTTEEANEKFAEEMGFKIHDVLYKLREEVYAYCNRPSYVPLDAFVESTDARMVYDAIVNLQGECSARDILP